MWAGTNGLLVLPEGSRLGKSKGDMSSQGSDISKHGPGDVITHSSEKR